MDCKPCAALTNVALSSFTLTRCIYYSASLRDKYHNILAASDTTAGPLPHSLQSNMTTLPRLPQTGALQSYSEPIKRIHDGPDVQFFLQSLAYRDITTFILQLNHSLVPRKRSADGSIKEFRLGQLRQEDLSPRVKSIQQVIAKFEALISEAPPDTGPRRFGNVSFRKWYQLVEDRAEGSLRDALPVGLHPAIVEVQAYLLGSFGSAQRLDYGSGHELSFLAFLACLWKLHYFNNSAEELSSQPTKPEADTTAQSIDELDQSVHTERQIILALFQPYLSLVRMLIQTYNLEPAGSHGVWGLDDNSFLPYIFGSAQLCPPIPDPDTDPPTLTPTSGSLPSAPDPNIVTKRNLVEIEATHNLYFSAILFIHDIKRGPFWEHSPMLFDISGIKDGWGKINKGLIKMYDAEVLSKFPVVQHFPFGSVLKWEKDPDAKVPVQTTHQTSQPLRDPTGGGGGSTNATVMRPPGAIGGAGTAAPRASSAATGTRAPPPPAGFVNGVTQAPWAKGAGSGAGPGAGGRMPPPTNSRQPLSRPMHSQASKPSSSLAFGGQSFQPRDGRPVSAATQDEAGLADKTAETIVEESEKR